MRKDGSDHKHTWEKRKQKRGDLVDEFDYCPVCGLRSRKGETQHPVYAKKA